MDQRGRLVATRGVPTMLVGEESVLDMGLGSEQVAQVQVWIILLIAGCSGGDFACILLLKASCKITCIHDTFI